MSFLLRQVAHCDVCGHEWLTKKVPSHCAKCKSRKWNQPPDLLEQAIRRAPKGAVGVALTTASGEVIESRAIPQGKAPSRKGYVPPRYR